MCVLHPKNVQKSPSFKVTDEGIELEGVIQKFPYSTAIAEPHIITRANKSLFIGSLLPQRSSFSNIGEGLNTYIQSKSLPDAPYTTPPYFLANNY